MILLIIPEGFKFSCEGGWPREADPLKLILQHLTSHTLFTKCVVRRMQPITSKGGHSINIIDFQIFKIFIPFGDITMYTRRHLVKYLIDVLS